MSNIYELYQVNRNMHVFSLMGSRELAQRIVDHEDLKNSGEKFINARKQANFCMKVAVDEFEVSKAMKSIFKGMEFLMAALIELKVVKDVFK